MPSYEDINYSLRPAKHIERRMILEALQRLRLFDPVRRYRYIGFGSTYFADFRLFHRALGIKTMISIEQDEERKARFLFNRPFRTVQMKFGTSGSVLPTLSWTMPTITWLDYDGPLTSAVLGDIDTVSSSAVSGSVLVVTVNAHPTPSDEGRPGARIKELQDRIGARSVPLGITADGHLAGWRLAAASRTVIDSAIRKAVQDRSLPGAQVEYEQLFNFRYRDGARMATVGGVLFNAAERPTFTRCSFADLAYIRGGDGACEIRVPCLTNKEARLLDRHLPAVPTGPAVAMLPPRDLKAYAETYRFFPTFVDADV